MRVIRASVAPICAVCERTLLQGERAIRFSPDGQGFVDVCTLCQDTALDHGWVREGLNLSPAYAPTVRKRRQKTLWQTLLGARADEVEPVVSDPILRRLSDDEIALVEAAELFNQSQYRRTVESVARSLGQPQVSIVPLSGVNAETAITIAWEISWYQYRVSVDAVQPVRIAERGQDIDEIAADFTGWNASLQDDGRLVPELVRV